MQQAWMHRHYPSSQLCKDMVNLQWFFNQLITEFIKSRGFFVSFCFASLKFLRITERQSQRGPYNSSDETTRRKQESPRDDLPRVAQ